MFLSQAEKDLLRSFADNTQLLEAVKKVVLADVYYKGTLRATIPADPTRNAALAFAFSDKTPTNEQLGQDIRAFGEAVRLVEGGFSRVDKFKTPPPPVKPPVNQAR